MPRSGRCWVRSWRLVRRRDLWIDGPQLLHDRFPLRDRRSRWLPSSSASTPRRCTGSSSGKRKACGRIETGARSSSRRLRVSNDAGEILFLRRVTVVLDKPTRDGDTEIHLLTNLPAKGVHAEVVADLYRQRWTIETAFEELEATLDGEINTLGYPKAALFAFCVALVSYNVLSTIKAALRSVHGEEVGDGGCLGVLRGG